MRIKKNINLGIVSWSNTKFSELTLWELCGWQWGELQIWSGSLRVKNNKPFIFLNRVGMCSSSKGSWKTYQVYRHWHYTKKIFNFYKNKYHGHVQ